MAARGVPSWLSEKYDLADVFVVNANDVERHSAEVRRRVPNDAELYLHCRVEPKHGDLVVTRQNERLRVEPKHGTGSDLVGVLVGITEVFTSR